MLAEPEGVLDLARLFPDVTVTLERDATAFARELAGDDADFVVLVAPPAGAGDVQLVASWLAARSGGRAVLLSSHESVALRLHALELGLTDAIDLGGDPMEVVGRLSIAGHQPAAQPAVQGRIALGDGIELDFRARALWRDGRLVPLRPKEYDLLEFLATHPGRAFTRHELLERVWQGNGGQERVVDVYVFWLRTKIERDARTPERIVTVRGSGYRFDAPDALAADASGAHVLGEAPPRS